MRVLIVDDNPAMRRVIRQYIESLIPGSGVIECREGGEALAVYGTERPDLVLMDIRMEPGDGLHATAAILSRHPDARICIVTNFDDQELREAARMAGACGYVTKDRLSDLRRYLFDNSH